MTLKHTPGGRRLPPKFTCKSPSQQNSSIYSTFDSPSSSGLDQEAENKFELELYWCIQQLELSVRSGKLSEKQMRCTQKNMDRLKSDNVALVQKRQLMRTTFGDYRAKMIHEEKKHGKTVSLVKISTPTSNDNKSIFIKKSQIGTLNIRQSLMDELTDETDSNAYSTAELSSLFHKKKSNQPFTFNFSQPDA